MKNKRCPECKKLGRDNGNDYGHLFLMKDGITWCCLREYHPPYYERNGVKVSNKDIYRDEMKQSIQQINQLPSLNLIDRKISKKTLDVFNVKVSCSEISGEIEAHYYPIYNIESELVAYKCRRLPKSFSIIGQTKVSYQLFGQNIFPNNGKKILICCGEIDALSAYEILKSKFPKMEIAIVSPTCGENMRDIKNNYDYISSFDQIYVAHDNDEAGYKFKKQIYNLFEMNVFFLSLSEKDISDMLVTGKEREFISAFFKASPHKPTSIMTIDDIPDESLEPSKWGLSYPFESLTKATYGLRTEEIIGIGAGPGAGKTSFIHQIQRHLIYEHGEPIGIFDIEETVEKSLKKLVGSIMNKPIHLPDCEYNIEEAREVKRYLKDKAFFYNADSYSEWEDIVEAVRYMRMCGVRYFFIDPLSALTDHLSASETNQYLNTAMNDMRRLKNKLGVTFFHVNHLNNPHSGKDHGAGGKVYGSQFSGSRAQWKFSTALWGLERNQLAEDEEERNQVRVSVIKDRFAGRTDSFLLQYNKHKGVLEEVIYEF